MTLFLKHVDVKNEDDGGPRRCLYRYKVEGTPLHIVIKCDWRSREALAWIDREAGDQMLRICTSVFDLPGTQLEKADAEKIAADYYQAQKKALKEAC